MGKAILVVCMHRSGTSAISGLLNELGIFMGNSLYGPQKGVNEKGFYENSKVVELNEKLFDALLQSWDDPFAFNHNCNYFEEYKQYEHTIQTLLEDEYSSHHLWGMKDPRVSLHLPFWDKAIKNKGVDPCFLMMIRHPIEVASSLTKRDGFSQSKGLMLWLNYTISTYMYCKSRKLCIVGFNDLLQSQSKVLNNISRSFDLELPEKSTKFIESSLKNNNVTEHAGDKLSQIAIGLYKTLIAEDVDKTRVDRYVNEYLEFTSSINHVAQEHCKDIKKYEVHFRRLFENAYFSFWWKVSYPLRKLEMIIRNKESH